MKIDKYFHLYGRKNDVVLEEVKWIPVTEALPEENGMLTGYLVSIGGDVTIMCFVDGKFVSWILSDNKFVESQFPVSAWMPLPEPWEGDRCG